MLLEYTVKRRGRRILMEIDCVRLSLGFDYLRSQALPMQTLMFVSSSVFLHTQGKLQIDIDISKMMGFPRRPGAE